MPTVVPNNRNAPVRTTVGTVVDYGLAIAEAAMATAKGDAQLARTANRRSLELFAKICGDRP